MRQHVVVIAVWSDAKSSITQTLLSILAIRHLSIYISGDFQVIENRAIGEKRCIQRYNFCSREK